MSLLSIKTSSQKVKFGHKEVNKKEFYSSKEATFLDTVDLSKIIVSSKWKISDAKNKCFCGYINNGLIQPLCVILSQMRGYIKYFDDRGKNMSCVTDDKEVYKRYNEIWEVVRKLLKIKFTVRPVLDDKYIIANLKIFKNVNMTTFTNNVIPEENTHYTCISAIDIDSVLKINKKAYPQAYLEQCDIRLKKRKRSRYIDHLESKLLIMIVIVIIMLKLKMMMKLNILNYLDNHHNHVSVFCILISNKVC